MDMKKIIILLSLLIPLSAFAAKDNFFTRAGADILAYFNTYYNAKVYYNEAQELYENEEDKTKLSTDTRAALNKASKQAELVMRKFPTSSFIDDCMFMNAICQFELQRYKQALDGLEELTLRYPDSPYYFESKLWRSKVFFEMDKKTIAYDLLEQFLANTKNKEYFSDAYSLIGFLALQEDNKEKALDAFKRSAEQASTKEDRCNMYLEAAELLLENANYDEALKLAQKANRNIKFDEQRARVQIMYTRIYRMQGSKQNALKVIEEAKADARISQYWGDLIYEEANIYFSNGEGTEASRLLRNVVKDRIYKNNKDSQAWVKSAYRLGEYYLYNDVNLDSAQYFFNQAKLKKHQAKEGEEAVKMESRIKLLQKTESALTSILKSTPALADSAWLEYEILKDSTDSEAQRRELVYADTLNADSLQIDSIKAVVNKRYYRYDEAMNKYVESANQYVGYLNTLAGYFLFDLSMKDTALSIYERIENDYYFTQDIPLALYSQAYVWEHELGNKTIADSIKAELIEKFPESNISNNILGRVPSDSVKYYSNQEKIFDIEMTYLDNEDYSIGVQELKSLLNSDDIDNKNHALVAYKIAWLYDNELSRDENTQDSTLKYYHIVKDEHPGSKLASRSAHRISAIETDISDYLAFLAGDSIKTEDINIDSSLYVNRADGDNELKRKEHLLFRRMKSPGRPRPQRL